MESDRASVPSKGEEAGGWLKRNAEWLITLLAVSIIPGAFAVGQQLGDYNLRLKAETLQIRNEHLVKTLDQWMEAYNKLIEDYKSLQNTTSDQASKITSLSSEGRHSMCEFIREEISYTTSKINAGSKGDPDRPLLEGRLAGYQQQLGACCR